MNIYRLGIVSGIHADTIGVNSISQLDSGTPTILTVNTDGTIPSSFVQGQAIIIDGCSVDAYNIANQGPYVIQAIIDETDFTIQVASYEGDAAGGSATLQV